MTRNLIERVLLFALPFLIYGAYLLALRMSTQLQGRRHPWTLLTIAGLALVAISFLIWGFTEGEPTTGTYVAPHVVNGKVVPGYVVPPPEPGKK